MILNVFVKQFAHTTNIDVADRVMNVGAINSMYTASSSFSLISISI